MNAPNIPALRLSTLFVLGIFLGRVCPFGSLLWFSVVAILSAGLVALIFLPTSSRVRTSLSLPLGILLAVSMGAMKYATDTQSALIPESIINIDVVLVGTVKTPPEISSRRTRFVIQVVSVQYGTNVYSEGLNILVTVARVRADTSGSGLGYGMIIGLHGKLSRLSDARNPGEFSPRQYYEASGINLTMRVKGFSNVVVLDSFGGVSVTRRIVMPVREFILNLINQTIGGREGEFLKGILIGERGGMSQEMKEAFANSGTAHVLAVSGSNVVVVAAFIFYLLEFLRIRKSFRVITTCIALVLYMLLTGSQPPVVRATIMALVLMIGGLIQEKSNPFNSLGVAALIILCIDARQLFDVGFQLSFGAVLAIMYLYPIADSWIDRIQVHRIIQRPTVWLLRVCALSSVATLGTLPLTAVYFGRVSVIGVLANIVVVPAVGISVILGFVSLLAGLFSYWLAGIYAQVNQLLLWITITVAEFSGNLSVATVETFTFRWLDAFPFYSGLISTAMFAQKKQSAVAIIVFLVALNVDMLVPRSSSGGTSDDKLRVSFLDVGQGDAILVEFPNGRTMLIDTGPKLDTYDAGDRIVVPFLKRRGITTLDLLVITHPHGDHMGGADAVFDHFVVRGVLDCGQPVRSPMFDEYLEDIRFEGCQTTHSSAGAVISDFSGARLYLVYPTPSFRDTSVVVENFPNLNNTSVVLKLCYGDVSFMFTGDAEEEAEHEMVRTYDSFLRSTVLKVGHHGSSTSSTDEFVRAVRPQHAVVSVGLFNKFKHPSAGVILRLKSFGADVSRTDEEGAVIFESDGKTISKLEWR